jgi:hypothetical protein
MVPVQETLTVVLPPVPPPAAPSSSSAAAGGNGGAAKQATATAGGSSLDPAQQIVTITGIKDEIQVWLCVCLLKLSHHARPVRQGAALRKIKAFPLLFPDHEVHAMHCLWYHSW